MKTFYAHGAGPWLGYVPHQHFKLPSLVDLERDAEFQNDHKLSSFVLEWPGQAFKRRSSPGNTRGRRQRRLDDIIPRAVLEHWGDVVERDLPVATWLKRGPFPGTPDLWPECLQYHVAVNWYDYAERIEELPEIPVCGLPHDVVQRVIGTQFAISPEYMSTIQYLAWLAVSLKDAPVLEGGFDSDIRDSLFEIVEVTIQKFFMMIGDCIFVPESRNWSRDKFKDCWPRLAAYLWWVGRTGGGMYARHAGIDTYEPWTSRGSPSDTDLDTDTASLWKLVFDSSPMPMEKAERDVFWEVLRSHRWDHSAPSESIEGGRPTIIIDTLADLNSLSNAGITGPDLLARLADGDGPHEMVVGDDREPVNVRVVRPKLRGGRGKNSGSEEATHLVRRP